MWVILRARAQWHSLYQIKRRIPDFTRRVTFDVGRLFIPEGFQILAGGKRSATTGKRPATPTHPGGMQECLILVSLRDTAIRTRLPVVALRLPPANVSNPFGMKVKMTAPSKVSAIGLTPVANSMPPLRG